MTNDEKVKLIELTRSLAREAGRPDLPITVGCIGQCTRDVIADTITAHAAGADFALVLVPSYFHFAMNDDAIAQFFEEVGSKIRAVPKSLTLWLTNSFCLIISLPTPVQFPL